MPITTADTALLDHLRDARRHLLLSYTATDIAHRDQIGALLTAADELLAAVAPTETEK